MATRNLARTVVERGKSKVFREMEAFHHRSERQAARRVLARINSIDDAIEAPVVEKRHQDWDGGFADSLAVAERFLRSRAGQPWDKVYSELCSKYDRNTTKGRHLIDLHIVQSMVPHHARLRWPWAPFPPAAGAWVDRHGILRYTQRKRWSRR
jgi:hypothetical protein